MGSAQLTATPYGNTRPTDDEQPVPWDIITEVWSDYRDATVPRSLDRTFREVGTQIFAETFEIPKTRKNTHYATGTLPEMLLNGRSSLRRDGISVGS
jgi:hypothetical protein